MATTWSRITSRFGIIGLFTCTTAAGLWFGCAGANPGYNPGGGSMVKVDPGCMKTPDVDNPDDLFKDTDCDGIDGTVATSIFVSVDGDDLNPGSPESPRRTINKAIEKAVELNTQAGNVVFNAIIIGKGDYTETVQMKSGISLHGGYDHVAGWKRDKTNVTSITGVSEAVVGDTLDRETHIEFLTLHGQTSPTGGKSTYALRLKNSPGPVIVRYVKLLADNGSDGTPGAEGGDGDPGGNGGDAKQGCEGGGSSCGGGVATIGGTTPGSSGLGGASKCGVPGGAGGIGGYGKNDAGRGGGSGTTSPAGAGGPGGNGGAGGDINFAEVCLDGSPGQLGGAGQNGGDGTNGRVAASTGTFGADGYDVGPANGGSGVNGVNGSAGGGGGGGGGSAAGGLFGCDIDRGGGGGGGGAGGCGGAGGGGGGGGGSSFGVYLWASKLTLVNADLQYGSGGNGGKGGKGGKGGAKGVGGLRGTKASGGEGGDGAAGQPGGNGGASGAGAGGSGGHAFGIFGRSGSMYVSDQVTLIGGSSGSAGVGGIGGQMGNPQAPNGFVGTNGNLDVR